MRLHPSLTLTPHPSPPTHTGAHQGRGLGRMFLRHLRRTRVLLHVVDAAAADPASDYWAVREELRMYNPDYVARPHVVALNKMDLVGSCVHLSCAVCTACRLLGFGAHPGRFLEPSAQCTAPNRLPVCGNVQDALKWPMGAWQ